MFLLVTLSGSAQKPGPPGDTPSRQRVFQVGASLGTNFSGLRGRRYYPGAEIRPQLGLSAGGMVSFQPVERLRLTGLIGGMSERYRTKGAVRREYNHEWAEATATFSYLLPVSRKEFDVFAGTGFTARRIMKATSGGEITFSNGSTREIPTRSRLRWINKWTYLLPFTVGTTLNLSSGGSLLIGLEYQLGLRERFARMSPVSAGTTYDQINDDQISEMIYSVCLKVAFLLSVSSGE